MKITKILIICLLLTALGVSFAGAQPHPPKKHHPSHKTHRTHHHHKGQRHHKTKRRRSKK